jgi:hypothetical protein
MAQVPGGVHHRDVAPMKTLHAGAAGYFYEDRWGHIILHIVSRGKVTIEVMVGGVHRSG